ncbi:MAG: SDR family oxidoreductase, partial [Burkholderiaceae bacterium]
MSAKPVIVITGAAGGIGIATIKALAAPGAQLHLIDSNESRLKEAVSLAEEAGASVSSTVSDLGTPQKCLAALPTGPGPIGALIHLAGIFVRHQMDEPGREIYNQTMQANATNAYDLVAAANNRLHKGSRIVFVSSLAFNRGSPDHIAYSMAKGSLVGLTRSLSKALGPRGVLV